MTLFDIEQYHQPKKENYKRDWDGASYDAAWDEPEDIHPILENETLTDKEVSLKEGEKEKSIPEKECRWNPKDFDETPRKVDSNGNPKIFWDESKESPEPDDFESLQKYSVLWQQWEKSSDNCSSVKEQSGNYNTTTPNTLKAISLWQPWASLIELGLKHYETRSWKTKYRGKLLICSAAKSTKEQYQQYLKIDSEVKLPLWDETNFLRGYALAICDLVDCIDITPEFINQQSQIEMLCGDWQVGRYAWKLENIQPIAKPFAVKGKQRFFDITSTNLDCYLEKSFSNTLPDKSKFKASDDFVSLPNKFLEDKLDGEISSRKVGDDSKFLEDKLDGEISSRKVGNDSKFLEDKLDDEISSRKVGDDSKFLEDKLDGEISSRKVGNDSKFLEDKLDDEISSRKVGDDSKFLEDKLDDEISSRKVGDDSKFLEDKLGGEISSRKAGNDSKFLEDKLDGEISSRKVGNDSKFLEDKLDGEISSRKVGYDSKFLEDKLDGEISSRKAGNDSKFLEDKLDGEISFRKVGDDSKFLEDNNETNISEKKTRRHKGDGSGCIYYRTVTKKGKNYSEAYYQYEFWKDGERLTKSSKYIPKRLLSQVQRLEAEKAPVKDILKLLVPISGSKK
ncbi:hypothetical protein NIES267_72990 (plasmid) [Calothrix parasitica NIES-267]|uniref:Uncharacterized protein n=1 Tax=Calothrix parasitica NIES-267 TaxID=1973488 RepID=A0A1Z4M2U5_9CYAN|nr:hypothetical protein NIES267_72990 [Calothrix parasitica NIES-267]